jgi:hypothetical protein
LSRENSTAGRGGWPPSPRVLSFGRRPGHAWDVR